MKKNPENFCLIGEKIGFSMSPEIHNFIFRREGIDAGYEIVDIPYDEMTAEKFLSVLSSYNGANVTIPHKRLLASLLKDKDLKASLTGSVNTIEIKSGGNPRGYNTDIEGIKRGCLDIITREMLLPSRMVLLGGGGAARSMIYAFIERHSTIKSENKREITVFLRNPTKGRDLDELMFSIVDFFKLNHSDFVLRVFKWDDRGIAEELKYGGLIVNATPLGSINNADSPAFDFENNPVDCEGVITFDMVYNPSNTFFLQSAGSRCDISIGGLGMLVYQALESLSIWFERPFNDDGIFEHLQNMGFEWFKCIR